MKKNVEPQSKKVYANRINIQYWDWGDNGLPMVMLHCSGGFGRMWDFLARYLYKDYHIICPDQRGHGDSDKPKSGYAAEDFAADLEAFIRELGLKKVILVGHSLGARVGIVFAARYPEKVSHLIMVGGPHYVSLFPEDAEDKEHFEAQAKEREDSQTQFSSAREAMRSLRAPTASFRSPFSSVSQYLSDEVLEHMVAHNMYHKADGSVEWKQSKEAVAQSLRHAPDDLKPYVKKIVCPILVPWGKAYRGLTPDKVDKVKPFFPTAQWAFLEETSYYIYLTAPEVVAKVIRDFLTSS